MARRTLCRPGITEKIISALRAGNYIEAACRYAGVSERVYYTWCKRGREEAARIAAGEEPDPHEARYLQFERDATRARGGAEVEAVAMIKQAAREDWRAAAWYLEHGHTERWGKRRVDVTSNGKTVFTVSLGEVEGEGEGEGD